MAFEADMRVDIAPGSGKEAENGWQWKKSETNAFPWQKKVQSKLLGVPFPFYVHFIVRNFRLINASLRGHGFTAVLQFRAIKKILQLNQ